VPKAAKPTKMLRLNALTFLIADSTVTAIVPQDPYLQYWAVSSAFTTEINLKAKTYASVKRP
jgi:hypothetical protein